MLGEENRGRRGEMKTGLGGQFPKKIITNSNLIVRERGLSTSFKMVRSLTEEPQH